VTGNRIAAALRIVRPPFTDRIQTYPLIRGERGDFSGIACAAA
jgi:hypothetical protein